MGVRRQQCASHLIRTSSIDVPRLLGEQDVSDLNERLPLTSCIQVCCTCPFHLSSHYHPLLGVDETISRLRDLRQHAHRSHVALEHLVRWHLGHLGRANLPPLSVRATTSSPSELRTGRARCAPKIAGAERRRSPRAHPRTVTKRARNVSRPPCMKILLSKANLTNKLANRP